MPDFFAHGSLLLIFAALLGAGMGLPISEDVVLLTTGALSERGIFPLAPALFTCLAGVLAGDFMLFLFGRHLGRRAYEHRWFRRIFPEARRQRTEALFERLGGGAVFVSRFLIGFRVPGFAMAGIMGMTPWKFLAWDAFALAITGPTVFFVGYVFSNRLEDIKATVSELEGWVVIGVVAVVVLSIAAWHVRNHILRRRERALGEESSDSQSEIDA